MPKIIHRTTLIIATLTILTVALYNATSIDIILTFAITLGTTSYHFIMRLLVGKMQKVLFLCQFLRRLSLI